MVDLAQEPWLKALDEKFETDLEAIDITRQLCKKYQIDISDDRLVRAKEVRVQKYHADLVSEAVANAIDRAVETVATAIHHTKTDYCWAFGEDELADETTREEARALLREKLG